MSRLPRSLVLVLALAESLGWGLALRSLVMQRIPTIVVAALVVLGARAALRERTWGVGLLLAAGSALAASAWSGVGPAWFMAIALAAGLPFLMAFRPMLRFDVKAAVLFAFLAIGSGAASALSWNEAAQASHAQMHAVHPRCR